MEAWDLKSKNHDNNLSVSGYYQYCVDVSHPNIENLHVDLWEELLSISRILSRNIASHLVIIYYISFLLEFSTLLLGKMVEFYSIWIAELYYVGSGTHSLCITSGGYCHWLFGRGKARLLANESWSNPFQFGLLYSSLTKQWRPDNFGTITEVADRFESNRRLLFSAFSLLTSKTEAPVSSSIIVLH